MDHVDGDLADFFMDADTKGIPVGVGRVLASEISNLDFIPRPGDLQYPILTMDEYTFEANLDGPDMVASAAAMTLGILPPMILGFFVYPYIGKSMIRGAVKG